MAKRICASAVSFWVLLLPAAHCQPVQPRSPVANAFLLALPPSTAQRRSPDVQASKDDTEIQACKLTMGTIKRMLQAAEELILLKQDADERKSDDGRKAAQPLDEQSAELAKRPETVAVLSKYGFTPRTYIVVFYAYFSAEVAAGELDARASLAPVNKAYLNAANIALVRAHKKEINELMQKYVYPHW